MFLVLTLSALFVLASGTDESKENSFIGDLSNAITYESRIGAKTLAAFWDKNEKTDQQSVEEFLKVLDAKVFVRVKLDVAGLVKNSLGKAVTKPEITDMYQVLQKLIQRYTKELTLGRARAITTNEKMKGNGPSQVGEDHLSKSIANWYDGVVNKNVTEEEKTQLINKSQAEIDAFIKQSINADSKPKSKTSTRSGSFFYNQHLQQQQQKHSSSVAHKLTNHMTTNMCSPQQPSYINNCHPSCQPHCTNCGQGYELSGNYDASNGHHSSYNHASGSHFGGVGSSGLVGSGPTNNILLDSINSAAHRSSYNHASSSNFGNVGSSSLTGSGHTHNGLLDSMNAGHHSSYNHASGSSFGGVGSGSLIGSGLTGSGLLGSSSLGNYGSGHSFSENSHNSHANSFDASMSGSSSSLLGHHGNHDLSGSYSGIANLWSLNKPNGQSGISGSSYGTHDFASGGSGVNSLHSESSHLAGGMYNSGNSFNQHSGSMSNIHGNGLGSSGGLSNMHGHGLRNDGVHYSNGHYSASNSKSDSSASQSSYGRSSNIW